MHKQRRGIRHLLQSLLHLNVCTTTVYQIAFLLRKSAVLGLCQAICTLIFYALTFDPETNALTGGNLYLGAFFVWCSTTSLSVVPRREWCMVGCCSYRYLLQL